METNEELEGKVAQRTRLLSLLKDVAVASIGAESVDDALRAALRLICAYNEWRGGHVYRLAADDRDDLVPTNLWFLEDPRRFEPFRRSTMATRYGPGEGIVGRVAESGQACWVEDVHQDPEWTREAGEIRTVFLFPVTVENRVVAVLEFFSDRSFSVEKRFLDAMVNIGIQLGQIVQRAELERRIANRTTEEQQRLGRRLHDDLGQRIAGIGMLADSLRQQLEANGHPKSSLAARIAEAADEAKEQIRAISRGLQPVDVDANGLMSALQELADHCASFHGVACSFECERPAPIRDAIISTHLYYIAQEAVHNAIKHAEAENIVINLQVDPHETVLRVLDDGKGIESATTLPPSGMGIRIMRYRSRMIGGRLVVESAADRGTKIVCSLPNAVV